MNASTALTNITSGPLAAYSLIQDADAALELLRENLGNGGLTPSMITRVKFPSGGGTTWEIPDVTAQGGIDSSRAIEGVILHWHAQRAYFENRDDKKPICKSNDAKIGEGRPGGNCAECQFGKWGSDGKGKACKEKISMYIVRENDILPIRVSIPSTSLRAWQQFGFNLFQKRRHFSSVVVRLTLKAITDKKDPYSIVEFGVAHLMDEAEAQRAREEHARFLENLASFAAAAEDEHDDGYTARRAGSSPSAPPPEPPDDFHAAPPERPADKLFEQAAQMIADLPKDSSKPEAAQLPLHASDAEKRRCDGYRDAARQLFKYLKDQSQNPEPAKDIDAWGPPEWAGYLAGLHSQTVRLIQTDVENLLKAKSPAVLSDVDHARLKGLPSAEVDELLAVAKMIEDKTGIPF